VLRVLFRPTRRPEPARRPVAAPPRRPRTRAHRGTRRSHAPPRPS